MRLESGRSFSAMIVDAGLAGVDRDLARLGPAAGRRSARRHRSRSSRDWNGLGATAVLDPAVRRGRATRDVAGRPRGRSPEGWPTMSRVSAAVPRWQGALVAVTGTPGAGSSTIAAALAQGLARDQGRAGKVLLADLALDADQGLLHHAPDVVPGLPELVEAHRASTLPAGAVQSMVFDVEERGYHLLLGMRRRRGWSALRPRALDAAIDVAAGRVRRRGGRHQSRLRRAPRVRIVRGRGTQRARSQRHPAARRSPSWWAAHRSAPIHGLAGVLRDVCEQGVRPRFGRDCRQPRAALPPGAGRDHTGGLGTADPRRRQRRTARQPGLRPEPQAVEDAIRGGLPLPSVIVEPVTRAVLAVLTDQAGTVRGPATLGEPMPIAPGSLGRWFDSEADAV